MNVIVFSLFSSTPRKRGVFLSPSLDPIYP